MSTYKSIQVENKAFIMWLIILVSIVAGAIVGVLFSQTQLSPCLEHSSFENIKSCVSAIEEVMPIFLMRGALIGLILGTVIVGLKIASSIGPPKS
jgi:uncharacterized membrane protein